MTLRTALLATTAAGLLTIAGAAYAQELEEVVVTARKVEENLMTVPLAITAMTAKDIDSKGINNIQDLAQYTPGLFATNQTGGGSGRNDRSFRTVNIRGFSVSSALIFLDGAPVNGNVTPEVEDVSRVEVLKGPQSAYFGRSTFSGAINYITKEPSYDAFHGRVKGEFWSYNSTDDSVSFDGPIIRDKVALRVTGHYIRQGGQYVNQSDTSQRLGETTTKSVSAQLGMHLTDDLKVRGFFTFMDNDDGPPAQFAIKPPDMNCNLGGTKGPWWCGVIPTYDKFPKSYISSIYTMDAKARADLLDNPAFPYVFNPHFLEHGGLHQKAYQTDAIVDYGFADGWNASSLTAYHKEQTQTLSNLSFRDSLNQPNPLSAAVPGARPYTLWLVIVQGQQWDFSQELRVTSPQDRRLRFLVGGSYIKINNPGGTVVGETPIGNLVLSTRTRIESDTPAAFGGLYFDIIDKLTLSAEARYQWDTLEQQALATATGAFSPGPIFHQTYTSFSPRVILDYKYAPDSTAYALWSRGYRPGGFNTTLQVQPDVIKAQFAAFGVGVAYQQERLDNAEIGIKSTWLDGRARTTFALYKEWWRNGQNPVNLLFTLPTGGVNQLSAIVNIGAANLQGGEASAELRVTDHFTMSGTLSLDTSKLTSFTCADCLTILGNNNGIGKHLPQAPKWNWSLAGEYTDHLSGDYDWFARADYSHRGEYYIEFADVAKNGKRDLVNLHLGLRNEKMSVEAYVKNLTNNKTAVGAQLGPEALFTLAVGQEIRTALPDKRWLGIRASYNF